MPDARFDVVCLGNAIVDVIARADDDVLVAEGLAKGSMRLVDADTALALYDRMGPAQEISGGSAANTAAGLASFGARAAFIGTVADDELGRVFGHDLRAAGVHFATPPRDGDIPTARCLILVTPDGERTMSTFLGAAREMTEADVDADLVAASGILYIEGYLWDPPGAKAAVRRAAAIAREAGRLVALTLSDPFCVDRWRGEFLDLLRSGTVDLVFANAAEARSLYETADLDSAVAALREDARLAVVTRSEEGALVITREATEAVRAVPVETVVDTTGAGDLFAAGFLAGLAAGRDLRTAAGLGALAAAEVIGHIGARPQRRLAELAAESGLA